MEQSQILDGTVVRLASSGPRILIKIESDDANLADIASGRANSKRLPKSAKDTLIS